VNSVKERFGRERERENVGVGADEIEAFCRNARAMELQATTPFWPSSSDDSLM
jgi:hypothetical protein